MKNLIFKSLLLSSVCVLPAAAQQFIDCSEGNEACDVLYASDEMFVGNSGQVQVESGLRLKTNEKPLAESRPIRNLPSGNNAGYRSTMPNEAGQASDMKGSTGAWNNTGYHVVSSSGMGISDAGKNSEYKVILPKGATVSSDADNPIDGTIIVPNKKVDSRVDVLPDGSVQTTTIEVTTEAIPDGYQEKTRRSERLDTEKT